jgi:hypothetical protein
MKWADLSKEQKQYIMLGGIVAVALVYVIYTLLTGLAPEGSEESSKQVELDLEKLEEQVDKAEGTIRKERRILEGYEKTMEELQTMQQRYFPNEDNRYSWVTELIYAQSRRFGIEVQQISELGSPGAEQQPFERYAVQVNLTCSYAKLIRFVRYFEKSNPLMRIFEVAVSSNKQDAENHNVKLIMAWPTTMDIKDIEE